MTRNLYTLYLLLLHVWRRSPHLQVRWPDTPFQRHAVLIENDDNTSLVSLVPIPRARAQRTCIPGRHRCPWYPCTQGVHSLQIAEDEHVALAALMQMSTYSSTPGITFELYACRDGPMNLSKSAIQLLQLPSIDERFLRLSIAYQDDVSNYTQRPKCKDMASLGF